MHNSFILQQYVCYITILNSTVCRLRALHLHTVRLFTEGEDTRGCSNTICPPEDEQGAARNMLRIVVWHMYCWRLKELCIKLVIWKSLYCEARSKIHPITNFCVYLLHQHVVFPSITEAANTHNRLSLTQNPHRCMYTCI